MSDTDKPFAFSQFVPGFDFLKNLAGGAAGKPAGAGLPGLSNWVAPTLSVEEVDKRIQELKTVQYWLDQNGHALKATIQALEVQKMTLSTLRGMNVRMEDLASAFTRSAGAASAASPSAAPLPSVSPTPTSTPSPAPVSAFTFKSAPPAEPVAAGPAPAEAASDATSDDKPGVVDPLQWWGALTQQFGQIASSALQDAAQLRMPGAGAAGASSSRTASAPKKRATPRSGTRAAAPKPLKTTAAATRKRPAAKR